MLKGLADCGTESWSFDTKEMMITYYDKEGNVLLVEVIECGKNKII